MYLVGSANAVAQLVARGVEDLADHPRALDGARRRAEDLGGENVGELESLFRNIFTALAANDVTAAGEGVSILSKILTPMSGMESRGKKGGVKYKADYILNAVLLGDNVRPVPVDETDFLTTVVKQSEPQILASEVPSKVHECGAAAFPGGAYLLERHTSSEEDVPLQFQASG